MSYMRDEFDAILREYGHNVFLNRRTQTTDTNVGYSDIFERHTVRFSIGNTRSLPGVAQEQREGMVSASDRIYYFRYDVNPFDGDRIYEQDPRTEDKQTVWEIDTVAPMRGVGGEIVYYVAGVTRILPS